MINLVALEDKKRLMSDYRRRRWVVAGYLLLVVFLVSIVLVTTFYFSFGYRRAAMEKMFAVESKQSGGQTSGKERETIAEINNQITMFKNADQSVDLPSFTLVMQHLLKVKSGDIKIGGVDYTLAPDNSSRVSLRGRARNRKALVAYVDQLRLDPLFTAIESPVSNLISEGASNFSLTISVAQSLTSATNNQR